MKLGDALRHVRENVRRNNIGHTLRGGRRDPHGEPEGVVTRPDQFVGLHASTEILVKDMADLLLKSFPGFRWAIQPNEFGKVFNVFNLDFHGQWGYVIRYDDVMHDPRRRAIITAGREILRRFQYPSDRFDRDLMAQVKRNSLGEAIPDVSDLKASRFTRKAWLERQLAEGKGRVVAGREGGQIIEVHD